MLPPSHSQMGLVLHLPHEPAARAELLGSRGGGLDRGHRGGLRRPRRQHPPHLRRQQGLHGQAEGPAVSEANATKRRGREGGRWEVLF